MKIALVNNLYFPYNRGGAEQVVFKMAEDFRALGNEVFIITTRPKKITARRPGKNTEQINDESNQGGEKIYYFPSGYYNLAERSLLWRNFWQLTNILNLKKYLALKSLLKSERPDLVITHNLMGLGFSLPRLLRKLKIKHEHFLHDIQLIHPSGLIFYGQEKKIDSLSAKIYQILTRYLFSSPAKIISPSRWLLERHQERGFFKNSPTEVRPFKKLEKSSNLNESTKKNQLKKFLFVGQIEYHKGIFLLIEAFKKTSNSNLSLTIVGDGQKLEQAQSAAAGDERINFLGRVNFEEAQKIIKNHEALIVPSLCYENSPTIIYEAKNNGLIIIASNLGGIPELLEANDYLFKPEAQKLTEILKLVSIEN